MIFVANRTMWPRWKRCAQRRLAILAVLLSEGSGKDVAKTAQIPRPLTATFHQGFKGIIYNDAGDLTSLLSANKVGKLGAVTIPEDKREPDYYVCDCIKNLLTVATVRHLLISGLCP